MAPYWKRRMEGHRFFDWLACVFGAVILALMLFSPQPRAWQTYFGMAMCSSLVVTAAYRLLKGKRPHA